MVKYKIDRPIYFFDIDDVFYQRSGSFESEGREWQLQHADKIVNFRFFFQIQYVVCSGLGMLEMGAVCEWGWIGFSNWWMFNFLVLVFLNTENIEYIIINKKLDFMLCVCAVVCMCVYVCYFFIIIYPSQQKYLITFKFIILCPSLWYLRAS